MDLIMTDNKIRLTKGFSCNPPPQTCNILLSQGSSTGDNDDDEDDDCDVEASYQTIFGQKSEILKRYKQNVLIDLC